MRCPICKTSLKDEEMYVCDKCKKLPQQLAEKDKEIEELKRDLQLECAFTPVRGDGKTFTKLNVIQDFKNLIRKQVCDEIREKIKERIIEEDISDWNTDYGDRCWLYALKVDMTKILDQIEQAKESLK